MRTTEPARIVTGGCSEREIENVPSDQESDSDDDWETLDSITEESETELEGNKPKRPRRGKRTTMKQATTPGEEIERLKEENEALFGLLDAKNEEILTLAKLLKQHKAQWAEEEKRLKKEHEATKGVLRKNLILITGVTDMVDKLRANCMQE